MRTEIDSIPETRHAAHELRDAGYHLVPVEQGGKRPLIRWKESNCTHRLIDEWFDRFGPDINVAIHAGRSGIVGLDADTSEAAEWIAMHCPPTPMSATTPRGGRHAYFRAPAEAPPPAVDLFGIGLDVRSGCSMLLASPSWSQEHGRRWEWRSKVVPPEGLPVIDAELISRKPFLKPKCRLTALPMAVGAVGIRDVTRWIMGVPSVQGNYGSNGCFKVACKLIDAGFSRGEAMHWFRAWNARVPEPPWSDEELEHKLRSALNRQEIPRW